MDFMGDVRREFDDPEVVITIGSIRRALFTFRTQSVVDRQLSSNMSLLHELFDEEPEILFHDDPAKWAELLALRWGWVSRDELFVH